MSLLKDNSNFRKGLCGRKGHWQCMSFTVYWYSSPSLSLFNSCWPAIMEASPLPYTFPLAKRFSFARAKKPQTKLQNWIQISLSLSKAIYHCFSQWWKPTQCFKPFTNFKPSNSSHPLLVSLFSKQLYLIRTKEALLNFNYQIKIQPGKISVPVAEINS